MNSKHLIILVVTLILLAAFIFPACSSPAATTSSSATSSAATSTTSLTSTPTTEVKTLKFSYSMPKGSAMAKGFEWFATNLPIRSNGRFKVETYPVSSLIGVPVALDSARKGVAEIVMTSAGGNPSGLPLTLAAELPTLNFYGDSMETFDKAYKAANEFVKIPEVAAEYKGLHLLQLYPVDPYYIASKKAEIHKPADFKGLKVGGSGNVMEIITSNGGAKIQQVPPEAYLNLDKGVTDATLITWAQVSPYKIGEVCNYFLEYPVSSGAVVVVFNEAAWNGLTTDERALVTQVWQESTVVSAEGMLSEGAKGRDYLLGLKKTLTKVTDAEKELWVAAAQASVDKWKADAITNKVDPAIADKILAAWKDLVKKYR
jgi:TRAP-type transport system periplasmic protein